MRPKNAMTRRRGADVTTTLGARQASLLEYLWKHGPQSVAQLHRGIALVDDVAYTTIFTELSRLLKKGLVAKTSENGSHIDVRYAAAVTREHVISSVVSSTLGALIDAHGAAAVHGFVDAVAHDPQALAELRFALNAHRRKKR